MRLREEKPASARPAFWGQRAASETRAGLPSPIALVFPNNATTRKGRPMNRMKVTGVYGSPSQDGSALHLQINTDQESLQLALPTTDLVQLITQLMTLAVQAAEQPGFPRQPQMEITTLAASIPATRVDHGIASPENSVFIARCGAINMALEIPHVSLLDAAKTVQDLQREK